MKKIIFSFIIYCNLAVIHVYAYPFPQKPTSKSIYIENTYILESALENKQSLEIFLKKYSVNAQEIETGDTALHALSQSMKDIHQVLISSAQMPEFVVKNQLKNPFMENKYIKLQEMTEFLVIQNASPYIKNKKGEKVIESAGFNLYINHVLKNNTLNSNKTIYKVYLAGPEVFLPFYENISRFLQAQVSLFNKYHLKDSDYHIQGLVPPDESKMNSDYFKAGSRIYKQNRALMHSSHAIIANMMKYRDSSMDVGTAYEIGEMVQAKKTVVGYYDEKIYHFQSEESFTQYQFPHQQDLNHNQAHISEHLNFPDNLMVIMATVSEDEEFKIPLSSWEALNVLKSKLDSKTE